MTVYAFVRLYMGVCVWVGLCERECVCVFVYLFRTVCLCVCVCVRACVYVF